MSENIRQIGFSVSLLLLVLLICFFIYNIYSSSVFKIDVREVMQTDLMSEVVLESDESNIVISIINRFFDSIKKGDYQNAYDLLDEEIKNSIFDGNIENFKDKMGFFNRYDINNDYIEMSYISQEEYTDTELWIKMYKDGNTENAYGDIRVIVRVYNDGQKKDKIFIVSFNVPEEE